MSVLIARKCFLTFKFWITIHFNLKQKARDLYFLRVSFFGGD